MSELTVDIFNTRAKNDFYKIIKNQTIQADETTEESHISKEELLNHIIDYCRNYKGKELEVYKYSKLAAKTQHDNRDSLAYFNVFVTIFMSSIKNIFPNQNFDEIDKKLKECKTLLAYTIKEVNVPNDLFVPYLMGIIETIL